MARKRKPARVKIFLTVTVKAGYRKRGKVVGTPELIYEGEAVELVNGPNREVTAFYLPRLKHASRIKPDEKFYLGDEAFKGNAMKNIRWGKFKPPRAKSRRS